MSAAPGYIAQAISELRDVDNRIKPEALAPGVLRFMTNLDRAAFLAGLQARHPIFVRHLHPVDLAVDLPGAEDDPGRVAGALAPLLARIPFGANVAVQARQLAQGLPYSRYAVKAALDPLIEQAGGVPMVQGADQILSISITKKAALVGLSTAAENLSDWPGGEMRFRREEGQLSRAKFKLLEAVTSFGVPTVAGAQALDLGAAPGGWTSLLLERGMHVTAVDTGAMDQSLVNHPCLTFQRRNVREVAFPPNTFDLVTCDMSWNPLHTAALVLGLADSVRPGAHGVLTVKLLLQNPTRTIKQVRERLAERYRVEQVRQLFHNRDEVTIHMVKQSG